MYTYVANDVPIYVGNYPFIADKHYSHTINPLTSFGRDRFDVALYYTCGLIN